MDRDQKLQKHLILICVCLIPIPCRFAIDWQLNKNKTWQKTNLPLNIQATMDI